MSIESKLIGESPPWRDVVRQARIVAQRRGPVLLTGPTGCGKSLLAELLHDASGLKGPLVQVNCATLKDELAEAQLFGAERGAYTGADRRQVGFFEAAEGGTLFLDEIACLSSAVQARLLTVVETGRFFRLGSSTPQEARVRLVVATHEDLSGRFRQDLLGRLARYTLKVPALGERGRDVVLIARWLMGSDPDLRAFTLDPCPAVDRALLSHAWQRGVRELHGALSAASVLAEAEGIKLIEVGHLRAALGEPTPPDTRGRWVSTTRLAELLSVDPRVARRGAQRAEAGMLWRGQRWQVRRDVNRHLQVWVSG